MAFSETVFGSGHSFDRIIITDGLKLMARWETFQPKRYKDAHKSGFKWAIGFGHVEDGDVEPKIIPEMMELTEDEALEILRQDAESKAVWLRKQIEVPVTTYMFNALVSLTLNAGQGNVGKGPVLPLLNDAKYVAACAAFVDPENGHIFAHYNGVRSRVNGLICRRATEMAMFMTKVN